MGILHGRYHNFLISHAVLQSVPRVFPLVTQHFPRPLKHLRANLPPNTWASGVRHPPLGPAVRGGTEWEGIQCPMPRFCGTLFGSIAGATSGNFAAGNEISSYPAADRSRARIGPIPALAGIDTLILVVTR